MDFMKKYDVLVIGGGASGMVAAVMAARTGARVAVLEHMDILGKKILATGNGKCNFASETQGVSSYYGADPDFVLPVFAQYDLEWILGFFRELGIESRMIRGGYYPRSEQALSVAEALRMELKRLKVDVVCNCGIRKIHREAMGYLAETKEGSYFAKSCVMATGGKTYKSSGSDGSGFLYLNALGHHVTPLFPALIGFHGEESFYPVLAGIRMQAALTLYVDQQIIASETGELQFTNYGVSGIPVFQLSHPAARALLEQKKTAFSIDFYPELSIEELSQTLFGRMQGILGKRSLHQAFNGMFPEKLIDVLLVCSGLKPEQAADTLTKKQCHVLAHTIKEFSVTLKQWHNFDQAQVTAGGVDTSEINPETMESKLCPGLFFAGEMMDIDGKCGGFNLQWAWASGASAGSHAAAFSKE